MNVEKLFKDGITFEEYLEEKGSSAMLMNSRDKARHLLRITEFDDETMDRIKSIDKDIYVLVLSELWCQDCITNIPVLKKISQENPKIQLSFLSLEENREYFSKYKIDGEVAIPTIVFFDNKFNELGSFVGKPKFMMDIYKNSDQIKIIKEGRYYRRGDYSKRIAEEFLDIMDY